MQNNTLNKKFKSRGLKPLDFFNNFDIIIYMNIEQQLNQFEGLKLNDVVFHTNSRKCVVKFLYNPTLFKVADNIEKVEGVLKSALPDCVELETKFDKSNLDKATIALFLLNTILNNFPSLAKGFSLDDIKISIDGLNVTVDLNIDAQAHEFTNKIGREQDIVKKLQDNFFGYFTVNLNKKADFVGEGEHVDAIKDSIEFQNSIKFFENKVLYKISNVQHLIGKGEYNLAQPFGEFKDTAEYVVCGTVTRIDKRVYTQKTTRNGRTTETERNFYTFTIVNDGKYLNCTLFPRVAEEKKCELIEVDRRIAMFGKNETYKGRTSFKVSSLCICDFEKYVPPVKYKHANEHYHTIKPEIYEDFEQGNMFGGEDDGLSTQVLSGDYVVFDFETTGLESNKDEIIEIGAVKISKGKIVSTFSTFIKPSVAIPQEITDLTGITEEMVAKAPAINYVLPDFYKYCYGCGLVAHNIAFDFGFLSSIAKKMMYNFDNPQYDTMVLARQKLKGLKNFKLGTVCDFLGVSLIGAHRAVNDCVATAKVFLKLI